MHSQIALLDNLKIEYERQLRLMEKLETRLCELPCGSLSYKKGNYYRILKDQQILIPANWRGANVLIKELKERQYIKKSLPLLKNNVHCYEQVLKKLKVYDYNELCKLLPSVYQDFDPSILIPEDDLDPLAWKTAPFHSNPAFTENLIYESEGGLLVRSKAEAAIATRLEQNNLIFRYEPELRLGNKVFYPDFCVLRIRDRKLMYWEHFGKIDDPIYAKKSLRKLETYGDYGYRLGDNLIMTWEDQSAPLNFRQINSHIKDYLL